jgi:hypothetical protein
VKNFSKICDLPIPCLPVSMIFCDAGVAASSFPIHSRLFLPPYNPLQLYKLYIHRNFHRNCQIFQHIFDILGHPRNTTVQYSSLTRQIMTFGTTPQKNQKIYFLAVNRAQVLPVFLEAFLQRRRLYYAGGS